MDGALMSNGIRDSGSFFPENQTGDGYEQSDEKGCEFSNQVRKKLCRNEIQQYGDDRQYQDPVDGFSHVFIFFEYSSK
jgi:hypothetical protein